jgi:hypothetical protein
MSVPLSAFAAVRNLLRRILRRRQITRYGVLVDRVHDQLKQHRILTRVELHRLIQPLVLLFDIAIVRAHIQRVARVLYIRLLQLQLDRR